MSYFMDIYLYGLGNSDGYGVLVVTTLMSHTDSHDVHIKLRLKMIHLTLPSLRLYAAPAKLNSIIISAH